MAYARVWGFWFLYDDPNWVGGIHPGARAPFAVAAWLGGGLPWAFHGLVLGLHLVNGFLLWTLARRGLSDIGALTVLTLFWLHPLQVESVAYLSGGLEVLVTTYVLLACVGLLSRSWMAVMAGLACLYLAATLKWSALPVLVIVPLLAAPYWSRRVRAIVVSGAAIALGWLMGTSWETFVGWLAQTSFSTTLASGSQLSLALWRYLAFIVWPVGFSIEHDWLAVPGWLGLVAIGVTGLVGIAAATQRTTASAWVWIVGLVAPRALIPETPPLTEHHTYLLFLPMWLIAGSVVDHCRKESSWLTSMLRIHPRPSPIQPA